MTSQTSQTKTATFQSAVLTEHKEMPSFSDVQHKIRFLAYGEEVCPTTGKEHYQAFAYAYTPMRLTGWKKLFPTAHIEPMRGSFKENEAYCSKEGKYRTFGEEPFQGFRRDLLSLKRKLDEGCRPMDVAQDDEYFGVVAKHSRFAESYFQHKRTKYLSTNRDKPNVHLRIGPAGTGKTRWLDDTFGAGNWVAAPDNTGQWFDGCDCDVVLFDDVEAGQVPSLSQFKRLTDRYPIKVPVKGGFITWKPKTIVFTSNFEWNDWWPRLTDHDIQAIERRITKVEHVVYKACD